ncbi:MAG TPA: PKD domain-containing protein, partial [Cytophagaceae bacterium]|nr:PKD domain-containing protein [Cytophagaceae bacterium]
FLAPYYPGSPFHFIFPAGYPDFPPDSGVFNVKLIAINENGCKDSITKPITIYANPYVKILESNYTFDCSNPIKVLHSVNHGGHPPRKIRWSTGETTDNITINKSGQYSVTVTDKYGCDSTDVIDVAWPLSPQFATTPFCKAADQINFIDNTVSTWPLVSWNYTFGDGGTANTQNPSHVYAGNQVYNVQLRVTDNTGCVDSITQQVMHVLPDSIFMVNPSPLCLGQPLNLQSPSGQYLDSLIWDFGNGGKYKLGRKTMQYSNLPDTIFTFAGTYIYPAGSAGNTYNVKLRVKYNHNTCIKDYNKNISIFPAFNVGIDSLSGQCAGGNTRFYGSKKIGNPVTSWNWKFYYDDPSAGPIVKDSATAQNPVVLLPSLTDYDNYHAVLTATNSDGCVVSSPNTNFAILNLPPPVICASQFCATQNTQFFYFCNIFPEVVIDSVHWDFGDGFSTSAFEPFHIYADSGTYNVTAKIFNFAFGCSRSATIPIKMYRHPKATLHASDTCLGLPISFKDLSTSFVFDSISAWQWNFGDGATSTQRNPSHIYSAIGAFNIKLIVTNSVSQCTDTTTAVANVRPYPTAGFTINTNELITGSPILFTDMSAGAVKWKWIFGDGDTLLITDPLKKNPEHTYSAAVKSTTVTQIVYNQFNCIDTIRMYLDLNLYFILPNAFTPNADQNNDHFFPFYKGIEKMTEFRVFDRWGQKVYDGDGNLAASWDGKYNGVDQPLGVYVYYVKALAINGKEIVMSGKVTLLR